MTTTMYLLWKSSHKLHVSTTGWEMILKGLRHNMVLQTFPIISSSTFGQYPQTFWGEQILCTLPQHSIRTVQIWRLLSTPAVHIKGEYQTARKEWWPAYNFAGLYSTSLKSVGNTMHYSAARSDSHYGLIGSKFGSLWRGQCNSGLCFRQQCPSIKKARIPLKCKHF